jgi:hypothetical protein
MSLSLGRFSIIEKGAKNELGDEKQPAIHYRCSKKRDADMQSNFF